MKIVLIGAGNVGYHLGRKLHRVGEAIIQVFSRKLYKAKNLASQINAQYTSSLNRILKNADLYILAVHDDAIRDIAINLFKNGIDDKLIVHTSGATPTTIFENVGLSRFGVFYPLQTFSISKEPVFEKIPFCIDANTNSDIEFLRKLAQKISPNVHYIDNQQRSLIHVAAVFVNNFSNHLFHIADEILKNENLSLEILLPLIEETVNKIKTNSPSKMQTGPAKRGDEATIKNHLELLESNPKYQKIYELLTASIQESISK